ncbi:MAG TPA: acyltransferase [Frankiaceae bacterium]|nr:acyltransferase [Frankiaceae bacterium]
MSGDGEGRLDGLDGIRALAILAVLAFHTGAAWASGGSIGVDVFFVLSGFLITSLLLSEAIRTRTIKLRWFYARRVLRLLPALLVLLAAAALYAALVPNPVGTIGLTSGIIGSALYVSDFQAATGHVPVLGLVEHTWSLSIEEHFYLVWPVLLLMALRRGGVRTVVLVAGVLAVLSAVLPLLLWRGQSSVPRLYFAPDTRAQQLLVGCLLALALAHGSATLRGHIARVSTAVAPGALVALLAMVVFGSWRSSIYYLGGLSVVALLAAMLLAAVVTTPRSRLSRLLAWPPMVGIGRISYGLYLWHWPVYLVLNSAWLGLSYWPTQAVRVAVVLTLALTSYGVVEKPFLRLQRYVRPANRPHVLATPTQ